MKKNKIVVTITVAFACFILFLALFMQFKVVNQTDMSELETMRESELRTELASWKTKYEEITTQNEETYEKTIQYQEENQTDTEKQDLLQSEITELNSMLGTTDVEGQGIEITIKEGEDAETSIEAIYLILIVNALRSAGAEAISINGERIVAMSDIVDITNVNTAFIKINGQKQESPYVIKAIGNQSYLEAALVGSGGQVTELNALGHSATIERKDTVEIAKYSKEISNKYIK
jgi:uncharacterized protein YlxW (UPF0749 family)